jgi:hypothetical protein
MQKQMLMDSYWQMQKPMAKLMHLVTQRHLVTETHLQMQKVK